MENSSLWEGSIWLTPITINHSSLWLSNHCLVSNKGTTQAQINLLFNGEIPSTDTIQACTMTHVM